MQVLPYTVSSYTCLALLLIFPDLGIGVRSSSRILRTLHQNLAKQVLDVQYSDFLCRHAPCDTLSGAMRHPFHTAMKVGLAASVIVYCRGQSG